jgi:hypothetical protein
MFFATFSGYYIPLLLTICFPLVLLFSHPKATIVAYQGTRLEITHFESISEDDVNIDLPSNPLHAFRSEPFITYPVLHPLRLLSQDKITIFFINLLSGSGNKAPPTV